MKNLNSRILTFLAIVGLFFFFLTSCEEEKDLCIGSQAKFDYEINQTSIILEWYTNTNQWSECLITVNNMKMLFIKPNGDTISPAWFLEEISFIGDQSFQERVQIPSTAEIGILTWETGSQQATKRFEFEPDGVQDDDDEEEDDDEITPLNQWFKFNQPCLQVKIPDLQMKNGVLQNTSDSEFQFLSECNSELEIALLTIRQFNEAGTLIKSHSRSGFLLPQQEITEIQVATPVRVLLPQTTSLRIILKDRNNTEYISTIPGLNN